MPISKRALLAAGALLAAVAGRSTAHAQAPALPSAGAEAGLRTIRYHREDEDWRWLARGARVHDAWDSYKYIPLGGGAALSLGADLRAYGERYANEAFGAGLGANSYVMTRALVHADLRLDDHVRLFAQVQNEGVPGRRGGPRPRIDRDDLDLNQGFVEVSEGPAALRVGRQELRLGVGRIVSTRDGNVNVRQPLDGARLIVKAKAGRLDVFAFRQVLTAPGLFDDRSAGQPYLWGANFAAAQKTPASPGLEAYVLGYDSQRSTYYDGAGAEHRRTLGGRLFLNRNGWDQDLEANYQFGAFSGGSISAWSAIWEGGYTFRKTTWQPRLGWGVTAVSGDRRKGDRRLNSYRPFVVRAPWGQLVPFGLTNVSGVQLVGNLQPTPTLRLTARNYWMRRTEAADGIYSAGYLPLRPGSPVQSQDLAMQTELQADWDVSRHLRATVALSHVRGGAYIRQGAPAGKDIDYGAMVLLYRF